MTNPEPEYKNREPYNNEEIDDMLKAAGQIEKEYFRLRVKVHIGIATKFGAR